MPKNCKPIIKIYSKENCGRESKNKSRFIEEGLS